jgi:hypothetical protein
MEGVGLKNTNLLSAISVSGRLLTRRSNFLKKRMGLITFYALIGQLASRRPLDIGSASCYTIFQVSNRTLRCILNDLPYRLYGHCMEPVYMAKYTCSLPMAMVTDLTKTLIQKKPIFYVFKKKKIPLPCTVLRMFLNASRYSP